MTGALARVGHRRSEATTVSKDVLAAIITSGATNISLLAWMVISILRLQRVADRIEIQISYIETELDRRNGRMGRKHHVNNTGNLTATGYPR